MIKVEQIYKAFGRKVAVDGVSFEVKTGEVLGFLGANGAGKSTTMRMITGYYAPDCGRILVAGHDVEQKPRLAKACLGYLPESAALYADGTVAGFLDFMAGVKGLRGTAKKSEISRVVEICGLGEVLAQPTDTLSKGYRHRTCFAQALLNDPPVLVLDEPTDGLDPNQKHDMRKLIREMGRTKAIIVSTHILEELDAICTGVIILDKGRMLFNGTAEELRGMSDEAGMVTVHVPGLDFGKFAAAVDSLALGKAEKLTEGLYCVKGKEADLALRVRRMLEERRWEFDELHRSQGRLDTVFRKLTMGEAER